MKITIALDVPTNEAKSALSIAEREAARLTDIVIEHKVGSLETEVQDYEGDVVGTITITGD
jgi:hypothetical protein